MYDEQGRQYYIKAIPQEIMPDGEVLVYRHKKVYELAGVKDEQ